MLSIVTNFSKTLKKLLNLAEYIIKETRKKGFKDMSIGLFNAQYKLGIDTTTLKQVSNEILKRAAEKNSQYNTNTSSLNNIFKNTNNIGIDL